MVKLALCLFGASMAALASAGGIPEDREAAYQRYLDYQGMIDGGRVAANWLPDGSTVLVRGGRPERPQHPQGRSGGEYRCTAV